MDALSHMAPSSKELLAWLCENAKAASKADLVKAYIDRNGPYLYHAPHKPELIFPILREGLLPRQDDTGSWTEKRIVSRSGYVYMADLETMGYHIDRPPVLQIDIRKLDPELLTADEDVFDLYNDMAEEYEFWYEVLPCVFPEAFVPINTRQRVAYRPNPQLTSPPERNKGSLSEWADENANILTSVPAVTYSLACGLIAHHGPVSPDAIQFNQDGIRNSHIPFSERQAWHEVFEQLSA